MRGEIEILITQCKEVHSQLKAKDSQIKKQQIALTQFETILQEKDAEIQKREQYLSKMNKQLEDKKEQLHHANIKMKQISKNVFSELNAKLSEKDKELLMLKGMVKGHHLELETKNKDIVRLKKEIKKLKKANEVRGEFIETFFDENNEEHMKHLKKLEEINNESNSGKSDNEQEAKSKSRKASYSNIIDKSDLKLPAISQTDDAESKRNKQKYSERYIKKVDSYNNMLSEGNYHNNSSNLAGILSQNYNAFAHESTKKNSHSPSPVAENLTPNRSRKRDFDINVDVNEIIRKSLGKNSLNYPNAGKLKVGNLNVTPVIHKVKIRKNSNM